MPNVWIAHIKYMDNGIQEQDVYSVSPYNLSNILSKRTSIVEVCIDHEYWGQERSEDYGDLIDMDEIALRQPKELTLPDGSLDTNKALACGYLISVPEDAFSSFEAFETWLAET